MRHRWLTLCYFAMLLPCATLADEGRIPIAGQKVITQPGAYVVTRDISVTSGIVVDVRADGVTIDLNGHTLSSTGILEDLLSITGCGARGVTIGNGRFQGGRRAIHTIPPGPCRVAVHDVQIGDPNLRGILVEEGGQMEIHGVIIDWRGPGAPLAIELTAPTTGPLGAADISGVSIRRGGGILMNHVTGHLGDIYMADQTDERPVELIDCDGSVLHRIIINDFQSIGDPGIRLTGSSGVLIEQCSLHSVGGGAGQDGIYLDAASGDCTLRMNAITGFHHDGVHVLSPNNFITGNQVGGNTNAGIYVAGANNLVEANKVGRNGLYGLYFDTLSPGSDPHVYRNNVLRGNPSAVAGPAATAVTNAGGNVL